MKVFNLLMGLLASWLESILVRVDFNFEIYLNKVGRILGNFLG